jgi:hypothetical protein
MKVLKAIVLLGLIYGVLYFGLKFFFSSRGTPLSDDARKALKSLEILRDELAVFEQKIHDLQRSGKPFDEEEEAVEGLKQKIQALKQRIAAGAPAQSPGETAPPPAETGMAPEPAGPGKAVEPAAPAAPAGPSVPARGLFADTYQRVFVGIIVLFVLSVIALSIYRRRQRPVEPEAETGPAPKPRHEPKQTTVPGDLDLGKTFERFQAEAPQVNAGKTTQFNLETLKSSTVEKPSVVDQIEIAQSPPPEPASQPEPSPPPEPAPQPEPSPPPEPAPQPEPSPPSEPAPQPEPSPPPEHASQPEPSPPPEQPPPSEPAPQSGPVPGKAPEGSNTVKQVFELHDQGMNIEQISEQLHIDQDQVRLMLRFKQ